MRAIKSSLGRAVKMKFCPFTSLMYYLILSGTIKINPLEPLPEQSISVEATDS